MLEIFLNTYISLIIVIIERKPGALSSCASLGVALSRLSSTMGRETEGRHD